MFRRIELPWIVGTSFPHACGDVPPSAPFASDFPAFSPRLWGCSAILKHRFVRSGVFPTPVGMFRQPTMATNTTPGFPHACGDVPDTSGGRTGRRGFSPRLWGCSANRRFSEVADGVFPTPVGMFRLRSPPPCRRARFSPRLWGCSAENVPAIPAQRVFPTPVGMFRGKRRAVGTEGSFPHACGDVPAGPPAQSARRAFSPRLWGCSREMTPRPVAIKVFPTPVGMFREHWRVLHERPGFPHACGDVPGKEPPHPRSLTFSPRLWGCSVGGRHHTPGRRVFPTPVGMFRRRGRCSRWRRGFPHACGDVPSKGLPLVPGTGFSPRLWGCSVRHRHQRVPGAVFPTPVGMFRGDRRRCGGRARFPHACGDVPPDGIPGIFTSSFSPRLWGCSASRRGSR